jgi:hypothetical protein
MYYIFSFGSSFILQLFKITIGFVGSMCGTHMAYRSTSNFEKWDDERRTREGNAAFFLQEI